ncbi:MAG TPA: hypothetical protein VKM55_16285 [Candidatus Lokiarchaeia archaeon]|nr:hypothetical protein [Candidatus Lokiarchaeia archaeon]
MVKLNECNYACYADPETCTPSEGKIADQKENVLDSDDDLNDELNAQEERERDEFAKRWEDIDYLVQKPFCCK